MILVSVPHSGTRFFHELIRPDVTEHFGADPIEGLLAGHDVRICVLRRPEAVWQSWWNRGGRRRVNLRHKGPSRLWYRAWADLERFTAEYEFHYLTIDTGDRERRLRLLGRELRRDFGTDWQPVRVSEFREGCPKVDFRWIYRIPVVKRFYSAP